VFVYPVGADLSTSAVRFLAGELAKRRCEQGTRWRRLSAGRQALLVLAHLRCGHTYAHLGAGFGVGTTTAYRYIAEAVEVLAALAPGLAEAMRTAATKAFVILDGTLLPIDRIAADRPFYSGKHKKHGMNVQVITDATGMLLWASPALPGAVHDIKAARTHGIIDALADVGVACWADKAYRGASGTIRVPYWGRWETLSAGQQAANRSHTKIRALVEQAMATLKTWRLLRKLRCSTTRITRLVQAVLTLHLTCSKMRLEKAQWLVYLRGWFPFRIRTWWAPSSSVISRAVFLVVCRAFRGSTMPAVSNWDSKCRAAAPSPCLSATCRWPKTTSLAWVGGPDQEDPSGLGAGATQGLAVHGPRRADRRSAAGWAARRSSRSTGRACA
jgi:hypothetical protein